MVSKHDYQWWFGMVLLGGVGGAVVGGIVGALAWSAGAHVIVAAALGAVVGFAVQASIVRLQYSESA